MKNLLPLLLIVICSNVFPNEFAQRIEQILRETPLIDGHNDIPWQIRRRVNNDLSQLDLNADLASIENPTHTDIPRLRRGRVGGQFWSVYVPIREYGGTAEHVQQVIEQIDVVHQMADRYSETFEMAYSAADVERIHRRGKIASLIGIEGGHAINDSLAVLRQLYQLGARYMTLTHSKSVRWADSATDKPRHGGLTMFGEGVIREMNRLGMLVDISHVSREAMQDAMTISKAPVIFSHSSAYAVVPHVRNVPDDMLELIDETNGVVMVTFFPSYVSEATRLHGEKAAAKREQLSVKLSDEEAEGKLAAWRDMNPTPRPTLEQVADHIDHIRKIAGIEHIGIGGDYDGMPPGPIGLEDVATYPALLEELLRRGYSDDDIAKIAGRNILRVMRDVEKVAHEIDGNSR